jgi:peptidyl-dipeptidase Dcp
MRALFVRSFVLLLVLFCLAIADFINDDQTVHASVAHNAEPNPLVAKWEGPYGGVPTFDRVEVGLFKPALETAMSEKLGEVQSIASNHAAPTFENTIVALETSGRTLER